jgi:hypothetical protein
MIISRKLSGSKVKRDEQYMRAGYKLNPRKTLSYIKGDSWTCRLSWMRDLNAVYDLFMSHDIWTMHAFKI